MVAGMQTSPERVFQIMWYFTVAICGAAIIAGIFVLVS